VYKDRVSDAAAQPALTPPRAAGAGVLGLLAGVFSGLLGVGGGLIMVPGMALGLRMRQHVVNATSLAAIIPTAVAGVAAFGKASSVDWKVGAVLVAGAIPGARVGAMAMRRISAARLRTGFGVFVIVVGIYLLVAPGTSGTSTAVGLDTALVALAVGFGSGVVSGLLGIGGGVLMVPAMVLLLSRSQHVAEGTSLLVIIPTALVGAFTHWRHGYVALRIAAILGAAGIAGAVIGSHIALAVRSHTLLVFFVIYLVVMGVRMVIPSRRSRSARPRTAQAAGG
jgi:uncharacterized membrane protein YfcA